MRKKIEKIFWDMETIGNRRKKEFPNKKKKEFPNKKKEKKKKIIFFFPSIVGYCSKICRNFHYCYEGLISPISPNLKFWYRKVGHCKTYIH